MKRSPIMKRSLIALECVLLAAPALAQSVGEKTGGRTTNDIKGLVNSGKVKAEIPAMLDNSHQSKLDKLKNASGKDFSSDFNSDQVSAHKDAVSLFERYAKRGDNPELKDWAGKTLPTLRHHLEMAQDLGKAPSVGLSK
jgi:putative membrane protein